jgi:hypothetical protein
MSLVTRYQELSGHHRKVIFWLPKVGTSTAARLAASQKARDQALLPGGGS